MTSHFRIRLVLNSKYDCQLGVKWKIGEDQQGKTSLRTPNLQEIIFDETFSFIRDESITQHPLALWIVEKSVDHGEETVIGTTSIAIPTTSSRIEQPVQLNDGTECKIKIFYNPMGAHVEMVPERQRTGSVNAPTPTFYTPFPGDTLDSLMSNFLAKNPRVFVPNPTTVEDGSTGTPGGGSTAAVSHRIEVERLEPAVYRIRIGQHGKRVIVRNRSDNLFVRVAGGWCRFSEFARCLARGEEALPDVDAKDSDQPESTEVVDEKERKARQIQQISRVRSALDQLSKSCRENMSPREENTYSSSGGEDSEILPPAGEDVLLDWIASEILRIAEACETKNENHKAAQCRATELESELLDARNKILELESTAREFDQLAANVATQRDEMISELLSMQDQIKQAGIIHAQWEKENSALKLQLENSESEKIRVIKNMERESENMKESLKAEFAEMKEAGVIVVEENGREIASLKKKIEDLSMLLSEREKELGEARDFANVAQNEKGSETERLLKKIEQLETRLEDRERECNELQVKLAKAQKGESENSALTEKLTILLEENEDVKRHAEATTKESANTKLSLEQTRNLLEKETDDRIKCEAELQLAKIELGKCKKRLEELKDAENLASELKEAQSKIDDLETIMKEFLMEKEKEVSDVKSQLAVAVKLGSPQSESEVVELKSKLANLGQENAALKKERDSLVDQMQHMALDRDHQLSRLASAIGEDSGSLGNSPKHAEEEEDRRAMIDELKTQLVEMNEALGRNKTEFSAVAAFVKQITPSSAVSSKIKADLQKILGEVVAASGDPLSALFESLARRREETDNWVKEKGEFSAKIRELTRELEGAHSHTARANARAETLRKGMERLQNEYLALAIEKDVSSP